MGSTEEGDTLTNSRDAMEYDYKLGQRVFEADLAITSDDVVVLRHDWLRDSINQELADYSLQIYVHTVNETSDAQRMAGLGADGIYTDYILPKDMKQLLDSIE